MLHETKQFAPFEPTPGPGTVEQYPAAHVPLTQLCPLAQQVPAQAAVVCWQPQVQVVVFKVWPLAQLVTQLPPHRVVPAGHWQEQVPLLKLAPPVQVLLTQRPLHRVVPAPHTHLQ